MISYLYLKRVFHLKIPFLFFCMLYENSIILTNGSKLILHCILWLKTLFYMVKTIVLPPTFNVKNLLYEQVWPWVCYWLYLWCHVTWVHLIFRLARILSKFTHNNMTDKLIPSPNQILCLHLFFWQTKIMNVRLCSGLKLSPFIHKIAQVHIPYVLSYLLQNEW